MFFGLEISETDLRRCRANLFLLYVQLVNFHSLKHVFHQLYSQSLEELHVILITGIQIRKSIWQVLTKYPNINFLKIFLKLTNSNYFKLEMIKTLQITYYQYVI